MCINELKKRRRKWAYFFFCRIQLLLKAMLPSASSVPCSRCIPAKCLPADRPHATSPEYWRERPITDKPNKTIEVVPLPFYLLSLSPYSRLSCPMRTSCSFDGWERKREGEAAPKRIEAITHHTTHILSYPAPWVHFILFLCVKKKRSAQLLCIRVFFSLLLLVSVYAATEGKGSKGQDECTNREYQKKGSESRECTNKRTKRLQREKKTAVASPSWQSAEAQHSVQSVLSPFVIHLCRRLVATFEAALQNVRASAT